MKNIITIIILLSTLTFQSIACSCIQPKLDVKESYKEQEFIATIKIIDVIGPHKDTIQSDTGTQIWVKPMEYITF